MARKTKIDLVNEFILDRGWNVPLWTHEEWYGPKGGRDPLAKHCCKGERGVTGPEWRAANPGEDLLVLYAGIKVARMTRWQLDHILPKSEDPNHHHSNIRLLPGWLNNRMSNKGWTHEEIDVVARTDPERPLFELLPEWWCSAPLEEFLGLIPVSGLLRS